MQRNRKAMAARVLRVARSPLYSPADNAAKTFKAALVRLGLDALRDIVLDVSLQMRVFKSKCCVARPRSHCMRS